MRPFFCVFFFFSPLLPLGPEARGLECMQSIAGWFCSSFLRRSLCQGCGDPWGSFDHSKPREGDQEDQQQHGGIGQVVCRFSQNRNWLDSRQDRSLEKNPTFHPTQPFCLGKKTDNAFFMNDFLWQLLKLLRFIFFWLFFFSICMPLVQDHANTVSTAYLKEIRTMLQSKSTSLVEGTQVASGMMLKELAGYAEARICCRDFFGVYKLQYLHLYSYKCTYIYIYMCMCANVM